MSKAGLWKNIFGQKEKVSVSVEGKTETMTRTQSLRFNELQETREPLVPAKYTNPLESSRYSLADAAFRLMLSENELLQKAADGQLRCYIDAAGLTGRWRKRAPNGEVTQSQPCTIATGLLRLRSRACQELEVNGHAEVTALDYCEKAGSADARLDDDTLMSLFGWGQGDKQFFPEKPLFISRDLVILLPPLR